MIFKAPLKARQNAALALKWKSMYPKEVTAMTPVGWARARQLANNRPLSLNTVKRMAAFIRHKNNAKINPKYRNTPWKDNGYVAWLGWGGTEGINWARREVKKQMN